MSSRIRSFLSELKRRRVFRVAVVYTAVAFVVWQAAEIAVPGLNLQDWVLTMVILLTILGFPIALVLGWALEMTPEGIRVTEPTEPAVAGNHEVPATAGQRRGAADFDGHPVPAPSSTAASTAAEAAPMATPASAASDPPTTGDPADDRPCVVVLPFANLSGDPENEAFSDGVTEDIMARLAGIRGLRVISRTSAMTYKGSRHNLPQIAGELGADAVVEGTVRRSADRVRVTAQLIAAERDEHLWADTYDRVLEDVFSVQSDVAENIARALHAELTPGEQERLERQPTENPTAYELCLKGWGTVDSFTPEGLRKAERYFREAIALDPHYARAWAGLAGSLGLRAYFGDVAPHEFFPAMRAAANEAVRLDPDSSEAHLALAYVAMWYEWDWAKVDRELGRALELNPDDSLAIGFKGYSLMLRERFSEAEAAGLQALRLDPLSQLRNTELAQVYCFSGKPERGLAIVDSVLRRDPQAPIAWLWRGNCHYYLGDLDSAGRDAEKLVSIAGRRPMPLANLAMNYAFRGKEEEVQEIMHELRARADEEYVDPYFFFLSVLAMDGFDAAFPYLQQMLDNRSILSVYLRAAAFHELRSDPRFLDALRTIWPGDF